MAEAVQLPPQAIEAEMAVLGSMLIERDAVQTALEFLEENHFYKDAHRRIFGAMANLAAANQAVDLVTVTEELRKLKCLGDIGGPTYLNEIIHTVSTAAHAEYYAKLVRDKAILRELISTATKIVSACYTEAKESSVLLDEAQAAVLSVAQKQAVTGFIDSKTLAPQVVEEIERLHRRKQAVTGVATGLRDFDSRTAGLQKGDLILIAARPSQGKTALALSIASNVILNKSEPKAVAFFSLEMSQSAIMTRLIAQQSQTDLSKLRTGFFPKDSWSRITTAAAMLSEAPLSINDTPSPSVLEVRSMAKRLANDLRRQGKELGLVMIDYLQLIRGSSRRSENRQQEVSEISRSLKALARDLNVPVVALSQLSRRVEDKGRSDARPQLSDLRESGALEQDADLVAFIYREGYYKQDDPTLQNKAEIIIAKQRNGPTGTIEVAFIREHTRFANLSEAVTGGDDAPTAAEMTPAEALFE